jgi:hypothetical protein
MTQNSIEKEDGLVSDPPWGQFFGSNFNDTNWCRTHIPSSLSSPYFHIVRCGTCRGHFGYQFLIYKNTGGKAFCNSTLSAIMAACMRAPRCLWRIRRLWGRNSSIIRIDEVFVMTKPGGFHTDLDTDVSSRFNRGGCQYDATATPYNIFDHYPESINLKFSKNGVTFWGQKMTSKSDPIFWFSIEIL